MINIPIDVKEALQKGTYKKNYKITVYKQDESEQYVEDFVIDNNSLVSESVFIDERMCSADRLTFGLCEGTLIQFKYFNHPNITERKIYVELQAEYPIGKKSLAVVKELEAGENEFDIDGMLGEDIIYSIHTAVEDVTDDEEEPAPSVEGYASNIVFVYADGYRDVITGTKADGSYIYTPSTYHGDVKFMRFKWNGEAEAECNVVYTTDSATEYYNIPIGWFDVKESSKNFVTGITKVTAYNKLRGDTLDKDIKSVIEATFGKTATVTLRELRTALLDDYEISEGTIVDQNVGKDDFPPKLGIIKDCKIFRCGSTALKTTATKGINTPFSYYMCSDKSSNIYPYLDQVQYTLDVSEFSYVVLKAQELEDYENTIYNYLYKCADPAFTCKGKNFLAYLMGANNTKAKKITFSRPVDDYAVGVSGQWFDLTENYKGWISFLSVAITYKNNKTYYYSTVGKNNKVSGITGTFSQLNNKMLKDVSKIKVTLPVAVFMYNSPNFPTTDAQKEAFEKILWQKDIRFETQHQNANNKYYYRNSANQLIEVDQYITTNYDTPIIYITSNGVNQTDYSPLKVYSYTEDEITDADLITLKVADIEYITIRDIISSVYELNATFGRLDRVTDLFSALALNGNKLYPADTLYPSDDLIPTSTQSTERTKKSAYQKLWTDSGGTLRFKYLIVDYKGKDASGNETIITTQRTINTHGNVNYNMTSNWILLNSVWTSAQIEPFITKLVESLQGVEFFPFEMWASGMPWLECGDEIEVNNNEGTYLSYVLRRELTGVQNLRDTLINGTLDIF